MAERRDKPYIWVTWLTKLLVGENSCEWASWFRANHESRSYDKVPSNFDATEWQLHHTELLSKVRAGIEAEGRTAFTEGQNSFTLRGRTAVLGGKPDLIAVSEGAGTILDVKTGQPSPSHHVQVMLYMYAVPKALHQYNGISFDGRLVYPDHEDYIPNTAVDDTFINNLSSLIQRLASPNPARRVPSGMECGFCNITSADCPERVESGDVAVGETEDF
jgi:hypothetical protein